MTRPSPAWSAFLPTLLLLGGLALPEPARAGWPADADARKKTADDKDKKDGKEDKKNEKDEKEQPKEPPFDKLTKGARKIEGLFNVYVKDDDGKYFLEVSPKQLDTPFLLNPTLVSGVGQGFLYPSDMLPEYVVSFRRVGKTIQLIHRNALFRAAESSSMHGPASVAAPDAIVGQAKIESQPHPDSKSVLIDLGAIVVGDLEGMGPALKQVFEAPYALDKDGSSIAYARGFPENLDFETVLHFKTPEVKKAPIYAADPRSLLVRFRYSISRLPETGYRPRLADDRVGHFLAMVNDYSDDRQDQPTVRYVNRWQLDKKDPSQAVSEPKQPIVFYLENTIPQEYRGAVRRGILAWNPAFEAIGFRNALVVKDQPADPDWDAADVRYSTIRWIVAPNAGFAQGPSRTNPYTGQIFDADIRFSADMLRGIRRDYDELVVPVSAAVSAAESGGPLRALAGWTSMLGPYTLDSLVAPSDPAAAGMLRRPLPGAGARPGALPGAMGFCDYAVGLTHQVGLGWSVMQARGLSDPKAQQEYVEEFLVDVTMHEVGHTLGLRHNFKASGILPIDALSDAEKTRKAGLTGSVMDYNPVNLAVEGKRQGEYFQSVPGPYDYWAIEYAYKPIDAASSEAEVPALEAIASRVSAAELAYGTDEDTFTGTPKGIDPTSNMWDLGTDVLAYYATRADIARELLANMEERFSEPGLRYQKLRLVFSQAFGEILPAAVNVPKYVGGIRHHRDHIGDPGGRVPYVPVPASEQRAAMAFLNREIFGADAFKISPRLFNKLAVERFPDIEGNYWTMDRIDMPIHTIVLQVQSLSMDRLYHPIVLSRLVDTEQRYEAADKAFTIAEMFSAVRKAVWSELGTRSDINSFRRNLQRKHMTTLVNLVVQTDTNQPEDARTLARADLIEIRRGIDRALQRPEVGRGQDAVTRAHLDETRARITAALDAGLLRQLPPAARPQG